MTAMWEIDVPNERIIFSENWLQVFGYSNDEISDLSQWADKIHPDDIAGAKLSYENYLSGKTCMYQADIRYMCKDGSYKWIRSKGIVIARDIEGKPVRIIGMHTSTDTAHIISHDQYREIFDYSVAIICTHDLKGRILTINPAVEKTLGYAPEELIGQPISSLVVAEHRDSFDSKYISALLANGTADGVMKVVDKMGLKKYLLYHNHLFTGDGSDAYVIGFAQDITDRIKTEEVLKTSRDTFSSAFKYSAIGKALVSPEGNWLEVNDALCTMTEYSRDELIKLRFQDITHPDDLEIDLRYVSQMLNKEIDNYNLEKRYITKTGRILWVLLTVSLVWDTNDSPKFFIAQIMDITQKKELADEINRKNTDLENIKDSLTAKVNQLEEFSYIVAHNVRGPAMNIKMLCEELKNPETVGSAFSKQEAIELIDQTSASLLESLDTLLSIAKLRLHKDIAHDECDIDAAIGLATSQLQGMIHAKKANIKLQLLVTTLYYPKAYLDNILYNLISNALKYSRDAIVPEIIISTESIDDRVVLSVKDNGLGIDLEKYGDRVFRLNEFFHEGFDSKGIGLYLLKTQIESLNGTITLKSKVNEGTEFIVTI